MSFLSGWLHNPDDCLMNLSKTAEKLHYIRKVDIWQDHRAVKKHLTTLQKKVCFPLPNAIPATLATVATLGLTTPSSPPLGGR